MPDSPSFWQASRNRRLDLDAPRVMGILNITPDSFSDGGRHLRPDAALAAAIQMAREGAAILDIGGESTRPGASRISDDEQCARIIPVIAAIRQRADLDHLLITVDTTRAAVAAPALDAGADAINDVAAGLEDPDLLPLAASRSAGIILMHRLHEPQHDSWSDRYIAPPRYTDVVEDVRAFLASRIDAAIAAGIPREAIVIDPGLGFGKSVAQNLELVRRSDELLALGSPILSAASRKSFVGRAMGLEQSHPADRLAGSLAFSIMHYMSGARIFRAHDVRPQVHALAAATRIREG